MPVVGGFGAGTFGSGSFGNSSVAGSGTPTPDPPDAPGTTPDSPVVPPYTSQGVGSGTISPATGGLDLTLGIPDYHFAINDYIMGGCTNGVIVNDWSGYGLTEIRTSDDPWPQDHGVFTGPEYLGGRQVVLNVTVRGDDPTDAQANIDELLRRWYLDSTQEGFTARSVLHLKLPGQAERVLFGRPRRATPSLGRLIGRRADGALEFMGSDPRWYSAALHTKTFALAPAATGRGFPRSYNYGYGAVATTGAQLIENKGTLPTLPAVRFRGPITDPVLQNVTTGQQIKIALVLGYDDYIDVDFAMHTVTLNGTASRYYAKTGDWWALQPGQNEIRFLAAAYSGAVATLAWRDAWL